VGPDGRAVLAYYSRDSMDRPSVDDVVAAAQAIHNQWMATSRSDVYSEAGASAGATARRGGSGSSSDLYLRADATVGTDAVDDAAFTSASPPSSPPSIGL